MGSWITPTNAYYEGDRASKADKAVPKRPAPDQKWNKADEKWELDLDKRWAEIRAKRNALLAETDFVILDDMPAEPVLVGKFTTYRQKLRDIPQTADPTKPVKWPKKPAYKPERE